MCKERGRADWLDRRDNVARGSFAGVHKRIDKQFAVVGSHNGVELCDVAELVVACRQQSFDGPSLQVIKVD